MYIKKSGIYIMLLHEEWSKWLWQESKDSPYKAVGKPVSRHVSSCVLIVSKSGTFSKGYLVFKILVASLWGTKEKLYSLTHAPFISALLLVWFTYTKMKANMKPSLSGNSGQSVNRNQSFIICSTWESYPWLGLMYQSWQLEESISVP